MPRIAQKSIEQVLAAADMVEIVGQYTQLRKVGASFSGRCPFHEERTPSFSVNPTEKLYYCFGCGAGGNLFGFVQAKENLDFAAAVESLADRYGIALEYEEMSARGDAERRRRERLRALLEQATHYYERVLWESRAAAPAATTSWSAASATTSADASALATASLAGTGCVMRRGAPTSPTRSCLTPAWCCPVARVAPTIASAAVSCFP